MGGRTLGWLQGEELRLRPWEVMKLWRADPGPPRHTCDPAAAATYPPSVCCRDTPHKNLSSLLRAKFVGDLFEM